MSGTKGLLQVIGAFAEYMSMVIMRNLSSIRSLSVNIIMTLCLLLGGTCRLIAYTNLVSTNPVVDSELQALATTQFRGQVTKNPLFPGTYNIQLFDINPNYVLPGQVVPSSPCQLDQDIATLISQSTWNYVYGFGGGQIYQQQMETGVVAAYGNLCANATNFSLSEASTTTWNKATCSDTIGTILEQLFNLSTSTPTPIPIVGL